MADLQDISYALVQVAHNFGATAVVGSAVFALQRGVHAPAQRKCAWVAALGWATQALSGMGFGAITYYYYAKPPDIHGLALGALYFKMLCATCALAVLAWYLLTDKNNTSIFRHHVWQGLFALGTSALTAAAFLRWFS